MRSGTKVKTEAEQRQLARDMRALRLERKRSSKVVRREAGASAQALRLSSPALTRWQAEADREVYEYLQGGEAA